VRNNVEAGVLEPAISKTKMIQVGRRVGGGRRGPAAPRALPRPPALSRPRPAPRLPSPRPLSPATRPPTPPHPTPQPPVCHRGRHHHPPHRRPHPLGTPAGRGRRRVGAAAPRLPRAPARPCPRALHPRARGRAGRAWPRAARGGGGGGSSRSGPPHCWLLNELPARQQSKKRTPPPPAGPAACGRAPLPGSRLRRAGPGWTLPYRPGFRHCHAVKGFEQLRGFKQLAPLMLELCFLHAEAGPAARRGVAASKGRRAGRPGEGGARPCRGAAGAGGGGVVFGGH
jgi:hypothetical protein